MTPPVDASPASLPRVDDHLVKPEGREVMVRGERVQMRPARASHATQHAEVVYLLRGCLAAGYTVAVDMLMRADEDSDIAPDVSVFPSADRVADLVLDLDATSLEAWLSDPHAHG